MCIRVIEYLTLLRRMIMLTRIAKSSDDMRRVYQMTYRMYLQSGYIKPNRDAEYRHYRHLDRIPETSVFVTEDEGKIVGTNSLTVDGLAGLHVDVDFPDAVAMVRQACHLRGLSLAASWRIITLPEAREGFKIVLSLITATMEMIGQKGLNVLLFSFNPRHEGFYTRLLGLHTIGTGSCGAVMAPGVLMRGDSLLMARKWMRLCKSRNIPYNPSLDNLVE